MLKSEVPGLVKKSLPCVLAKELSATELLSLVSLVKCTLISRSPVLMSYVVLRAMDVGSMARMLAMSF